MCDKNEAQNHDFVTKLLLTSGGEYDIVVKDFEKRIGDNDTVILCILL